MGFKVGRDEVVPNSTYLTWRPGRDELHLLKIFSKLLADRNGLVVGIKAGGYRRDADSIY